MQTNDCKGDQKDNLDDEKRLKSNPSMKMTNGDKECPPEERGTQPESQIGIKELKDMLKLKTCVLPCKCGSELHNEATCSQMIIDRKLVSNSEDVCQYEAEVNQLGKYANDRLHEETAEMDLGKSLRQ